MAVTLMVQGTTSDAGKSTVVAALCRWLHRQGVSVAPFKPQNMALNSAVTVDGGEIGRSTALQALACGLEPHSDMNPVLLKPQSDCGAQVILRGQVYGNMNAIDYHAFKAEARRSVMAAWQSLSEQYDVIIAEGAGSPAEVNLRANDIANMGFAEAADCPVLLVGDIDRGGVFAQLVGTLALLSESEQRRTVGFVINRFRGDPALLEPGLRWLETRTGKPVVGVLDYLHGLVLDAEDAIDGRGDSASNALRIIVPALPRISNHNDFDPLRLHPGVDLQFIGPDAAIPPADVIVLPGSKSTRQDLAWLRSQGWDKAIQRHLRYGGQLLGICGGYQMLGRWIADPHGLEGSSGKTEGLGLLPLTTEMVAGKQLRCRKGVVALDPEAKVIGYEIHNGVSQLADEVSPLFLLEPVDDANGSHLHREGAISEDGQIMGTYLHGLFDEAATCNALVHRWNTALGRDTARQAVNYASHREQQLNRLADAVTSSLDVSWLSQQLRLEYQHQQ